MIESGTPERRVIYYVTFVASGDVELPSRFVLETVLEPHFKEEGLSVFVR